MSIQDKSHRGDILVVDDRADNLRLLATMLSEQGYKVRKVIKGEMAFDVAQVNPPDLILLDIFMPTMSGFEVCQQLKADVRTSHIPIIFLSASDEPLDKVKAFAVGGQDYITKPFEINEVLARIEHQLRILRLQQQMQAQNQRLLAEISERLKAEAALRQMNDELDERVRERTAELTHTNQRLQWMGQKLEQSLAQEQELNRLRSRVITTISHEYRTPMAIISSSTGILEDYFDQLTPALRRKHLGRIQGAIQRMLALIDDVVLFNRLEFEPVEVKLAPTCLASVIDNAVTEINGAASPPHPIAVTLQGDYLQPVTDASLVRTVVVNLLSNAVKFSPDQNTMENTIRMIVDCIVD
ncbi:signal transduction histidine kinase [Leptolyngbya sp. BL0902]|uniref:hybrid sensor histidine kinase/response regulator n=1 Tax=Leptolyngbya sp. BL0902 TaxID=1115757 RepID=UPI0018E70D09|nr:hybrid sensor histidine kinase/response regulator [Leptolyngbya sp. BL0902]QQE65871.1 signal transduction histidine kinase [Leptolyngbya sp. BL0902]